MTATVGVPLIERVDELFRRQVKEWPLLSKGVSGLAEARTRAFRVDGTDVVARHIPHRVTSTTAPVDRESILRRPCFLCPENLDPAQKGLSFGADYTIYGNPFPILERHLTIVHREHRPQRLATELGAWLGLAEALPGLFVFYNGPECGASAPDHLHFQAASRDGLPIASVIEGVVGAASTRGARTALVVRGVDVAGVADAIGRALDALSAVTERTPEPWINAVASHVPGAGFTAILFPRAKHRPGVFHTGELMVSPAAIDLCGVLVVPLPADFERITGADVESVFREVCLSPDRLADVVARLSRAR